MASKHAFQSFQLVEKTPSLIISYWGWIVTVWHCKSKLHIQLQHRVAVLHGWEQNGDQLVALHLRLSWEVLHLQVHWVEWNAEAIQEKKNNNLSILKLQIFKRFYNYWKDWRHLKWPNKMILVNPPIYRTVAKKKQTRQSYFLLGSDTQKGRLPSLVKPLYPTGPRVWYTYLHLPYKSTKYR